MAPHVGAVTLRDNTPADVGRSAKTLEVDGLVVPLAARLMALAGADQILLSADAAEALGRERPAPATCGVTGTTD